MTVELRLQETPQALRIDASPHVRKYLVRSSEVVSRFMSLMKKRNAPEVPRDLYFARLSTV